ncbi:DNA repair protein RadC [Alkalihalobacillus xiaoxiensis]|uniref:DNA repair protein RadC n=1 Tax=Shouchella xiaoxiensis TaxID=766895 RepID=A0ABS2SVL3_9BACI|nr:JAB domain-containing protein [Shouchella xiaoxiensis]MBM7839583.1 DNA repair protein RadC [Shouchella xiaoxiensis]
MYRDELSINFVSIKLVKEEAISMNRPKTVSSPDDVYSVLESIFKDADREKFVVMSLDSKNNVNSINVCHVGTVNSSVIHVREVFKPVILSNGVSFIVAHNHPSGDTEPSKEDIAVTKRLQQAADIFGIYLLDHLIIGDGSFLSMKEKRYMG